MFFPVAGIEVDPWILPIVAFIISFFAAMGGLSGAFLLLPFQVSVLGFTSPSVSATNQLFNITAIPGGVYRYLKEGRMVWPLTLAVIIGTLPGVFIGAIVRIQFLPDPKNFKFFAGLVLIYIGVKLVKDLFSAESANRKQIEAEEEFHKSIKEQKNVDDSEILKVTEQKFSLFHVSYEFHGHTFVVNTIGIITLSFVVGIIGGIYGIGGGAIIAPFLLTFFGLPIFTIAGATLMGTFVTSIAGVVFYQLIAPYYPNQVIAPDWALGIFFGLGGFAGIYFGAKFQKFFPAKIIKWILIACILVPALNYIWQFIS
ncbi:MAG: sulfite exporter TauE/SafE family protein [Ignavibacteriae bacterium]|nr:MAG: sulfite exporter TauE/SafE family protein [Ignavibacteriota bacterium]